ncbi:hypothetical protein OBBRIDRAFT_815695 [Obba rivulosa]|uniref:Uncharacterized protein n=1 Tax=Obba rivulosa TaxID=1052685 RepID=A0A8E2AG32_9APHY|nr:hypothetical protein OBBRIDRAFT_815695 [Obba rivulosa]
MYMLFEAFPVVFSGGHGTVGLMYIPVVIGCMAGCVAYFLIFLPRYEAAVERHKPQLAPPELRLDMAMWVSPMFAIAFFWFGWTSYPSVSFWAPMSSGLALGFSCICLFLALVNYIIDVYLFVAASALAANTVIRSFSGAIFPLFATQMYEALDPRWASTLLGCFACAMLPIPFVLKRYGAALRAKSKFASNIRRA